MDNQTTTDQVQAMPKKSLSGFQLTRIQPHAMKLLKQAATFKRPYAIDHKAHLIQTLIWTRSPQVSTDWVLKMIAHSKWLQLLPVTVLLKIWLLMERMC